MTPVSKSYEFDTEENIDTIYQYFFAILRSDPNSPLFAYLRELAKFPDGHKHVISLVSAILKADFGELHLIANALDFEALLTKHLTYFLDECEQFLWKSPAAWTYVLESLPSLQTILEYRNSEGNNYMHLILKYCGPDTAHYILTHFNKLFDKATVKPEELKRRYDIILSKDKDGMNCFDYAVLKRMPDLPAHLDILYRSIYDGEVMDFPTVLRIDCTDVQKPFSLVQKEKEDLAFIDGTLAKSSKVCSGTDRSPYFKVVDDETIKSKWNEVTEHYRSHSKQLKANEFYRLFKDEKLAHYQYVRTESELEEAVAYLVQQSLVTVDVEYVPVHVDEPANEVQAVTPATVTAELKTVELVTDSQTAVLAGADTNNTETNPGQILSAIKQLERRVFIVASLQLATPDKRYFLDCIQLELKGSKLIASIFESNSILKIFHGGENDLEAIYRAFGILTRNIYDTAKASMVLEEFTNMPGLNTLSSRYFNAKLDKSFQKAVWRVRPLPQPMIEYAMTDAVSLMPIFFHQIGRLNDKQAEDLWQISNNLGKYVELRDKQLVFCKSYPAAKNDVF